VAAAATAAAAAAAAAARPPSGALSRAAHQHLLLAQLVSMTLLLLLSAAALCDALATGGDDCICKQLWAGGKVSEGGCYVQSRARLARALVRVQARGGRLQG